MSKQTFYTHKSRTILGWALFAIIFLAGAGTSVAQEMVTITDREFPKQIMPGTKETIYSKTDTFWVMNNEQMQNYAIDQLRLQKADSLFKIFQAEIATFQRVISQKNEIISRMNNEKKDLNTKLEACENEPKKKKKKKK